MNLSRIDMVSHSSLYLPLPLETSYVLKNACGMKNKWSRSVYERLWALTSGLFDGDWISWGTSRSPFSWREGTGSDEGDRQTWRLAQYWCLGSKDEPSKWSPPAGDRRSPSPAPPCLQSEEISHILEVLLMLPILSVPLVVKYLPTENEISFQKQLGMFFNKISLHFEISYPDSKHHHYWPNCPSQCGPLWAWSPVNVHSLLDPSLICHLLFIPTGTASVQVPSSLTWVITATSNLSPCHHFQLPELHTKASDCSPFHTK